MDSRKVTVIPSDEEFEDCNEDSFYNNKSDSHSQSFEDDILYGGHEDDMIQMKVSKHMRDLSGFLHNKNFLTEKQDHNTNIINLGEYKTYNIPAPHLEEFFTILDDCRKEKRDLHFLEKQETKTQSKSGIMIDFDRFQSSKEQQVKSEHFLLLARRITKLLKEFIDFTPFAHNGKFFFKIFIIRKPAIVLAPPTTDPNAPPRYKDGFHILIPEIQVIKGFKIYLLNQIQSRGILNRIFNDIVNDEEPNKMLDMGSTRNPVHFFGHSKLKKPAYLLTNAYESTIYMADDEDDNVKQLDVKDILQGVIKNGNTEVPINLTYELSLSFYLETLNNNPTWLRKIQCDYRAELETNIQSLVERTDKGIFKLDDIAAENNNIDMLAIANAEIKYLQDLLSIIDISYATDYSKWRTVLCAIAHTGNTEPYKKLAIWFSKRKPDNWSAVEFEKQWNDATNKRFDRKPVTKASIIYWAKLSSPRRFDEINSENYIRVLAKGVYENEGRIEHALVARTLYAMVGSKFVVDVDHNEKGRRPYCWFEFVVPGQAMRKGEIYKWRREINPDNIHIFVAEQMPKLYAEILQKVKDRKELAENNNEVKYFHGIEKTLKKYQTNLGNDGFQNGVVKQAEYKFRQRGFLDELDSYPDIIGVGNGVLKLPNVVGGKAELIRGFHEYKISKYTETDYIPFDTENPYIKRLLNAFHDIYPEDDVFEFQLMYGSTDLDGRDSRGIMFIKVGGGQNGKTFFETMKHNAIGNQYAASGKMTLLTSPSEKGESANSALMQIEGKRGFYFDESNRCDTINIARFKSLTSPGYQSGRELHSKQKNFKVTSNMSVLSNYDIIFDTTDHGTWRRVYYYKCKVKFCTNPDPNNAFEKCEDSRFAHEYINDYNYQQAMLSILVHYYEKLWLLYDGDIKQIPVPTIMKETEVFRNRQDAINRFITQMVVKSPAAEAINISVISQRYSEWYTKHVGKHTYFLDSISSQMENSCIAQFFERRTNNVLYLIGHRIKQTAEEPLQEGEQELAFHITIPVIKPPPAPLVRPEVQMTESDKYLDSFTKNIPIVIQTRDNIAEDIDIDELLKDLI